MRGNKRRGAVLAIAAKQSQPTALNDAILDVVNRKGIRCCVECGATSTPQWREGPMGPKTLCNACGVRRQRLLRKQQAATVGIVPTAPVAAVQARRRIVGRATPQSTPLESEDMPFGAASGSEHSSDETEVDWATGTANKQHHQLQNHHQHHPREQMITPQEVEESCNEDESAAYDLLFFAGVECGSQNLHQHHDHHDQQLQGHGHNTRRHVQPVRRQDDFFYYSEDEAVGLERGRMEQGGCKRARITALAPSPQPPPTGLHLRLQQHHMVRPWHGGPSLSSTEDMAESEVAFKLSKAYGDAATMQQQPQPQPAHEEPVQQQIQTHLQSALGQQQQQQPGEPCQLPPTAMADLKDHTSGVAPAEALGRSNLLALPSVAHFSVPMALPVLPLSLPLPALSLPTISTKDLEILVKLQLEFQRACMQLHHANVACEAVGAVVEERRQAAVSAHDQAAVASQQLAAEARAMTDRYRLRDVLNRVHADPLAGRAAPVAGGQAVICPEMMLGQPQPRSPAEQH
ncbi:hypothetical protein Vafri_2184 [Volvox africanus]|nr:hypothetical protein Vafri_2184 [Volvox africanus]